MKVYIERTNKHQTVKNVKTAKELLEKLGINQKTVIIVRNGTVIIPEEKLREKDEIHILSVISGG